MISTPLHAQQECILTEFTSPIMEGRDTKQVAFPIIVDIEFYPLLERINYHASTNNVALRVTEAFRRENTPASSSDLVSRAANSNHEIGHAIDMNVRYGVGYRRLCTSSRRSGVSYPADQCFLSDESTWPAGVRGFIEAIIADNDLRWGGTFVDSKGRYDYVHIDDRLNRRNFTNWRERYLLAQSNPECSISPPTPSPAIIVDDQPVPTIPVPVRPTTHTINSTSTEIPEYGDAVITLSWGSAIDYDLAVIDPVGNLINYENTNVGSGSLLYGDVNADCVTSTFPVEEISWLPRTASRGNYIITVFLYNLCGVSSPTQWTLTTTIDGISSTQIGIGNFTMEIWR